MRFFKNGGRAFSRLFKRMGKLKASKRQEFHNAEHLFDETQASTGGTWMNLHGYRTEDGIYYIGADYRWLGIRIQNVIVKCGRDYGTYYHWLKDNGVKQSGLFHELVTDYLPHTKGDTDTCFVFYTTDGKTKDYNVDQWGDVYAWIEE